MAQVVVGGPEDAGSFSACADATEGKTVEKSRKNTTNIDKDVAVEEPWDFKAFGINISSIDLKNVCIYALPAIGRATDTTSLNIVLFDFSILL